MNGLWREHPATAHQQTLFKPSRRRAGRLTQADVLLGLLRDARDAGRALELPTIMQAGIAQHGARFNELRAQGLVIENELDHSPGAVRSRYRLTFDPEREAR